MFSATNLKNVKKLVMTNDIGQTSRLGAEPGFLCRGFVLYEGFILIDLRGW